MTLATRSTITTFRAETRPVYTKSGSLRIETTVIGVERDILTGRFVSRAQGKFTSQQAVTRFLNQINAGELSGRRAMGILKSRNARSNIELVKSGFRSLVQMYEDWIPVSDYDRDRLAYMADKMSWDDFEAFYNQNTDIVERVYRVGSPRATDRDRNIIIPTEFERNRATDDLLDAMQRFLTISDEELDANVNPNNYINGRRKKGVSTPKFAKRFYS